RAPSSEAFSMSVFVLWVEGVDFGETLFDTGDLSTVRGASLTQLAMPPFAEERLKESLGSDNVQSIFSGASQAAFKLSAAKPDAEKAEAELGDALGRQGLDPAAVEKEARAAWRTPGQLPGTAPFAHLRFVTGLVELKGDEKLALAGAQAAARFRQLQSSGPRRPPPSKADAVCAIDRRRPADTKIWVKKTVDPADRASGEDEDSSYSARIEVSSSVAARRHYGRWARQRFYPAELRDETAAGLGFADSLHDIVARPPDNTPLALRTKIAVFYADGNKFGSIRKALAQKKKSAFAAWGTFSQRLVEQQREKLLKPLVAKFREKTGNGSTELKRFAMVNRERRKLPAYLLRLETLLWGGDEVTFVVPSWLGWWLAREFFRLTKGWHIEDHPLTFSAGLVFTSYKTPIRDARELARTLADIAKAAHPEDAVDALEVEALESVDPPLDGIEGLRERLAGVWKDERNTDVLTIEDIETFWSKIAACKRAEPRDDSVPRSQIYRILRAMAANGGTAGTRGAPALKDYEIYRRRMGRGSEPKSFALTPRLVDEKNFGLNFYLLAQQWDYIDPFKDELPAPAAGGRP
ncbi:MAG: Cas10/Cmr2 second palm domain-containing protein, partial [Hyphomicrobiaceae bacterium]